jgi:hypothetical protein
MGRRELSRGAAMPLETWSKRENGSQLAIFPFYTHPNDPIAPGVAVPLHKIKKKKTDMAM